MKSEKYFTEEDHVIPGHTMMASFICPSDVPIFRDSGICSIFDELIILCYLIFNLVNTFLVL